MLRKISQAIGAWLVLVPLFVLTLLWFLVSRIAFVLSALARVSAEAGERLIHVIRKISGDSDE